MINPSKSISHGTRRQLIELAQLGGDLLAVTLGLSMAFFLRFGAGSLEPIIAAPDAFVWEDYFAHFLMGLLLFVLLGSNFGLYDSRIALRPFRTGLLVFKTSLFWFLIFLGFSLSLNLEPPLSRLFAGYSFVTSLFFVCAVRCLLKVGLSAFGRSSSALLRVILVGPRKEALRMAHQFEQAEGGPYRVLGFVETVDPMEHRLDDPFWLGNMESLESLIAGRRCDLVIVADSGGLGQAEIMRVAKLCERHFLEFKIAPSQFEVFTSCLQLTSVSGIPLMGLAEPPANRPLSRLAKKGMDLVGALVGLTLSAPIIAVLAILIKRESPGPVFYRQVRVGEGGREFEILKLRSMRTDAEVSGAQWAVQDDPRRTRIGVFMRRTNLDELPQFWNVFKGEMSLVGPRPERPELIKDFLDQVPYYQSRHTVKPGMTGWAQVNGLRGNTSLSERIRYDLDYIERWSLWMDITIQLKTFFVWKNAY